MMERTQIYLTREERQALRSIAEAVGQSQSEIIREAIDQYIDNFNQANRVELMRAGFGIWADRDDVPELFEALRREWDERLEFNESSESLSARQ